MDVSAITLTLRSGFQRKEDASVAVAKATLLTWLMEQLFVASVMILTANPATSIITITAIRRTILALNVQQ